MKNLIFISLLIQFSCFSTKMNTLNQETNQSNPQKILIHYYQDICDGEGRQFCLLTRSSATENWNYLFGYIDGFEYEWGYTYKIEILKEKKKHPSFDGSTHNYKLLNILEKERIPPDETFSLKLYKSDLGLNDNNYYLLNSMKIDFTNHDSKTEFIDKLNTLKQIEAEFKIANDLNTILLYKIKYF